MARRRRPAAEDVERQICSNVVVVPVEEAAFLHAVERDVGVVEIDHDLARVGLDEQIDQQRIDLRAVAIDKPTQDSSRHLRTKCKVRISHPLHLKEGISSPSASQ